MRASRCDRLRTLNLNAQARRVWVQAPTQRVHVSTRCARLTGLPRLQVPTASSNTPLRRCSPCCAISQLNPNVVSVYLDVGNSVASRTKLVSSNRRLNCPRLVSAIPQIDASEIRCVLAIALSITVRQDSKRQASEKPCCMYAIWPAPRLLPYYD